MVIVFEHYLLNQGFFLSLFFLPSLSPSLLPFPSCTDVQFVQLANMLVSAHIDSSLRFWDTRAGSFFFRERERERERERVCVLSIKMQLCLLLVANNKCKIEFKNNKLIPIIFFFSINNYPQEI